MRVAAIVNPRSASGRTGKRWSELSRRLEGIDTRLTQAPGHATTLTAQLLEQGYERIVAVGGDGTVHEVVNGWFRGGAAINPEASLAILPLGTGSDFQKSLGIGGIDDAVALIRDRAQPAPIDAGRVKFASHDGGAGERYFINLVSFGMGGEVALASKNFLSPLGGQVAFIWATLKIALTYRAKTVSLEVDGAGAGEHTLLNIAIGNGRYHGGGMHVCPRARLDDGELEVTVIERLGLYELVRDMKVLYSDNIYAHPRVRHFRGRRVVATSAERVQIEVDGEALGTLPLEFTVLPGAIRVCRR